MINESLDDGSGDGLSVVVVNFGSHRLLRTHLVQVGGELPGAQIVVVDNYSTEEERSQVLELCAEHGWVAVTAQTNLGFGGGANLGAASAVASGSDFLMFLNPDATIDAGSTAELMGAVRHQPKSLVAPLIHDVDGRIWSAGTDVDLRTGDMRSWANAVRGARVLSWLSGACLVIGSEFWSELSGFEEDYFLYWEDVDLSARVLAAGGSLQLVESAIAIHDEGRTHTEERGPAKSALYYYYNVRNRALFAAKHMDRADQRRWRRTGLRSAYRVLMRGGRRQLLVNPRSSVRPALLGLVDGMRGRSGPRGC